MIGLLFVLLLAYGGYYVDGVQIYKDNQSINLYGVNWFGFETQDHVVHGLWSRNYKDMLDQIKSLGFNAIRLPFCTDTILNVSPSSIDYSKNPDLVGLGSLDIMKKIVEEAEKRDIYVLLDYHRIGCNYIEPLWYTNSFSEANYTQIWLKVANEFKNYDNVIGADLKNEPHGDYSTGAVWGYDAARDWDKAAARIGNAILSVAPNWLIFVEGTEKTNPVIDNSFVYGQNAWWGGNLMAAQIYPVNISKSKLVYSPHVYGPDVYNQPYFSDPNFPDNMPNIWETHFGYLSTQYPVIIGEFGGTYTGKDRIWQNKIIDWMINKSLCSFFYWSWNPNSGDTKGILLDDWTSVNWDKYNNLKRLMDFCSNTTSNNTTTIPGNNTTSLDNTSRDAFMDILNRSWLQLFTSSNSQDPTTFSDEHFYFVNNTMNFYMCDSGKRVELRFVDEWTFPANNSLSMSFSLDPMDSQEVTIMQILSRNNSYYKPLIRVYWKNGDYWVVQRLSMYSSSFVRYNLGSSASNITINVLGNNISIVKDGQVTELNVSDWPYNNFYKLGVYIQSGGCARLTVYNVTYTLSNYTSPPPVVNNTTPPSNNSTITPPSNNTTNTTPPSYNNTTDNVSAELTTSFQITSDWGEGFCAEITVTNDGSIPVVWNISWDKPFNFTITSSWNGVFTDQGDSLYIEGVSWNRELNPGESTSVGFCGERLETSGSEVELPYTMQITSQWSTGYCALVTVNNPTSDTVLWKVIVPKNGSIYNYWSSQMTETADQYVFKGEDWNKYLGPGDTTQFGYCAYT